MGEFLEDIKRDPSWERTKCGWKLRTDFSYGMRDAVKIINHLDFKMTAPWREVARDLNVFLEYYGERLERGMSIDEVIKEIEADKTRIAIAEQQKAAVEEAARPWWEFWK